MLVTALASFEFLHSVWALGHADLVLILLTAGQAPGAWPAGPVMLGHGALFADLLDAARLRFGRCNNASLNAGSLSSEASIPIRCALFLRLYVAMFSPSSFTSPITMSEADRLTSLPMPLSSSRVGRGI